ncbi:peptidase U32 family protein [Christensenella intestinihominis]|uniref:peptidase U32 family protein n=1 Tax=Christensenella intestinihominis TaxID=1851429 RepID=UPI00082C276F|nr:U32 family peptidase [Christensenella intestinihominis]
MIELLAPAGNLETLETALYFGADAVYMAGKQYGLRAFADNFTEDGLQQAANMTHAQGKKLYITVNSVLWNRDLPGLEPYLCYLAEIGADAVIVTDPAVLQLIKRSNIPLSVHISTQANTTNYLSASFWHECGASRVVLSREVSLAEIEEIRKHIPADLELEAFVHGSMCIAHSGRCLLSSVLTGRSGNRGACAQPCRWEYHLYEKGYEGQYFPVMEDDQGTYIMNSRDLMMIGHIPELAGAGVSSFKIEGRMKSAYYVASVVHAYRRALDAYERDPQGYRFDESLKNELVKSASRGFTTGFYFGNPHEEGQDTQRLLDPRTYTFAGKVVSAPCAGVVEVEQRNKFSVWETLEVLSPHLENASFTVESICDMEGTPQESAPHPQQHVKVNCPYPLRPGDLLRRHDERESI